MAHDRIGADLASLSLLSNARSRSISPENRNGAKGGGGRAPEGTGARAARELGPGWKISPSIILRPGDVETLADVEGPGEIRRIWMTTLGELRTLILRIYWEDQAQPSVECPLGDFFANAYGTYADVNSAMATTGPYLGLTAYWPMPFRERCRITLEHVGEGERHVYWTIDYAEFPGDGAISREAVLFHAQFRRSNPVVRGERHLLLDGVSGRGHYVGTYLDWGVRPLTARDEGWWGEGEMEFLLDGDEHPTIVGTGTEDYFGGAWNFDVGGAPRTFSHPYSGMPHALAPSAADAPIPYPGYPRLAYPRFGLYRWHVPDPIRFERDLKVRIQVLGLAPDGRFVHREDDVASTAFWYQTLPTAPFPDLPDAAWLRLS